MNVLDEFFQKMNIINEADDDLNFSSEGMEGDSSGGDSGGEEASTPDDSSEENTEEPPSDDTSEDSEGDESSEESSDEESESDSDDGFGSDGSFGDDSDSDSSGDGEESGEEEENTDEENKEDLKGNPYAKQIYIKRFIKLTNIINDFETIMERQLVVYKNDDRYEKQNAKIISFINVELEKTRVHLDHLIKEGMVNNIPLESVQKIYARMKTKIKLVVNMYFKMIDKIRNT